MALAAIYYGIEGFQTVPSRHGGDLGIEAFTHTGVAVQCYAARANTSVDERYRNQRKKLTEDLAKLERHTPEVVRLLGETKIKNYLFMVPVFDSRRIVQHATAKSSEYRAKNLPHLHPEFRVTVVTDEIFAECKPKLQRQQSKLRELIDAGRVRLSPIGNLHPVRDLGVHPAIEVDGLPEIPPYVPRDIDRTLDDLTLNGGLVVIEGNSAAGKTRCAFEALVRNKPKASWESVLIPADGKALRQVIDTGYNFRNMVVWLDDLEEYMSSDGLNENIARTLCPDGRNDVLLLCTLRSKAKLELFATRPETEGMRGDRLLSPGRSIAKTIRLDRALSKRERRAAIRHASDIRIAQALAVTDDTGLAEFISAGPLAVERWLDGEHGANELGSALVSAAVDIRLTGYLSPLPREWIEACATVYLEERRKHRLTASDFSLAWEWATHEIQGASSCLIPKGNNTYSAFDYLIDYRQTAAEASAPHSDFAGFRELMVLKKIPGDVWHELFDRIALTDPYFLSCASRAEMVGHPALLADFQRKLQSRSIDLSHISDDQIITLVRSCVAINFCVGCMIQTTGLDFGLVVERLITALNIEPNAPLDVTDPRVEDLLYALHVIACDARPDLGERPSGKAIKDLSPDLIFALASVFIEHNAQPGAYIWLACAARIGVELASELINEMEKPRELIELESAKAYLWSDHARLPGGTADD
ncbi:hypothetical protein SAMN05660976_07053 [Nonomuraea pusilla]|uniref:Uncharacterized protein n=2 Tax=Nonomuraea pusilla TaxID=46177 RepID=A0A1H8EP87_9ACTN|nr:hypothetical protein SAMN05660976_07053 [Nonomuraea pusilla]